MTSRRPPVAVRPLADRDVRAVLDVFESVVREGRWLGSEAPVDRAGREARLRAELARSPATQYVAAVDDRAVGHVGLDVASYGVASLGMLVVADWRGRGVGTALVEAAIAVAPTLGAHKIALQVWPHNRAAIALYRRFGFAEEGRLRRHYRRRNGELWDAVMMGLVLDETSPGCSIA